MTAEPYYSADGITIYCAEALDVLPELSGVGAVVTDPPYSSGGAFRGDRTRGVVAKYVQTGTLAYRPEFAGDSRDQRSFLVWSTLWLNAARQGSVSGAPVCVFSDWRQLPTTTDAVQVAGWTWRGIAVWAKGYGRVNGSGMSSSAEFVCWGTNGPAAEREDYPPGLFTCPPERGEDKRHVAQKPEAVMRWLLRLATPGALVLDPFMGSGTTLRAAMDLGLPAVGIDSDERYCEIAAKRLAQGVLPFGGVLA
ncbi:MAG TPA: site-specific DNA-methyltransferase [Mycobacteriales bacterium]|nr:site-specific DNA-methyltransferase [Mycobacteriales bacterium]